MDTAILESLKQLQQKLNSTSSSLKKQEILKQNTCDNLKQLFKIIFDSNITFNITSLMIQKIPVQLLKTNYSLFELLHLLETKQLSGHQAIYTVQTYIHKYKLYENVILDIIDKNLKIGMNIKQINKVFHNLINEFSVALAEKLDEKTNKLVNSNSKWFISRKLDGVRCICIIKNKTIKFYSRQGKEFYTLDRVKEQIQLELDDCMDNIVFDGEIAIIQNGIENFSSVMKEIRKKNHTIKHVKYFIFDVLTLDEFQQQKSKRIFSKRIEERPKIRHQNDILEYLPQYIYTEEKLSELQKDVELYNWEGLMLRKDTLYQGNRSKDLLKVKKFLDDEFLVKSIQTNTIRQYDTLINNYKQVETLGAVIIDYKGYDVSVGSGFTMEERNEFYNNPEKIIGKLITVQYFEEIKDKNGKISLRFPTFKALRFL